MRRCSPSLWSCGGASKLAESFCGALEGSLPPVVLRAVQRRQRLRRLGDYEGADLVRSELRASGWYLSDVQGGTRVRWGPFSWREGRDLGWQEVRGKSQMRRWLRWVLVPEELS